MRFPLGRSTRDNRQSQADDELFLAQSTALIPASVYMISGCHSEETSADVSCLKKNQLPDPAGRAGGACTSALLELLWQSNADLTYQQLLLMLRASLQEAGMLQIPQLTSSRPLENGPETPFGIPSIGTKRALLVGINYRGHRPGELSGCVNDCLNMKKYLMERHGFKESNILLLVDDPLYSPHSPTRDTIIAALGRLVQQSRPGDAGFFH